MRVVSVENGDFRFFRSLSPIKNAHTEAEISVMYVQNK